MCGLEGPKPADVSERAARSEDSPFSFRGVDDPPMTIYVTYAPGILLNAHSFPLENPSPTQAEIREALPGNLCPCTRYHVIVEAIEAAAQRAGAGRLALNPQEET